MSPSWQSLVILLVVVQTSEQTSADFHRIQMYIKSEIENLKKEMSCAPKQQPCHSACPDGFFRLPGYNSLSCYQIVYDNLVWEDAQTRCRSLVNGSHLIVIEDESENSAVVQYLNSTRDDLAARCTSHSTGSVWTSGKLLTRGNCNSGYVWKPFPSVNVPMNFTNWATGEPKCQTNYDSVQLWHSRNFEWDDVGYNYEMCSLCEYDDLYAVDNN